MKFLSLVGAVVTCLHLVSSQNQCTHENLEDARVVGPLITSSLVAGSQSSPPNVTIINLAVVCLSVDHNLNLGGASLVVEYTCTGTCPQSSGNS